MKNIDTETRMLREEEIKILDYIVWICEEHNIEYYLDFGTLLGSIRHKGFIPWDDDLDISMPRKDYEKFINICEKIDSSKFFLQTYDTDPEYYQYFAKMRNSETTFIEGNTQYLNINHGVYIDIFPIENLSSRSVNQYIRLFIAVMVNKMCTFTKNPFAFLPYKIAKIVKWLFSPIKASTYNHFIDRVLHNKDNEEKYLYSLENGFNFKTIIDKDILDKKILHEFEGKKYKIPQRYDEYLKGIYGDYMKLPPENERYFPHPAIVVDFKKGYKEYMQSK